MNNFKIGDYIYFKDHSIDSYFLGKKFCITRIDNSVNNIHFMIDNQEYRVGRLLCWKIDNIKKPEYLK